MRKCKACGRDFSSTNPYDEICYVCEKALKRLNGYAVPVEHGRWEAAGFDGHGDYKECCSNCKTWSVGADKLYCPTCGAKMDLEV